MKPKRWVPKNGEWYYFVNDLMEADATWNETYEDASRVRRKNCFRTKREAQEARKKIIKILKGER